MSVTSSVRCPVFRFLEVFNIKCFVNDKREHESGFWTVKPLQVPGNHVISLLSYWNIRTIDETLLGHVTGRMGLLLLPSTNYIISYHLFYKAGIHLVPLYLTSNPDFFSVSVRESTSFSDSINTNLLGRSISNFTSGATQNMIITHLLFTVHMFSVP